MIEQVGIFLGQEDTFCLEVPSSDKIKINNINTKNSNQDLLLFSCNDSLSSSDVTLPPYVCQDYTSSHEPRLQCERCCQSGNNAALWLSGGI